MTVSDDGVNPTNFSEQWEIAEGSEIEQIMRAQNPQNIPLEEITANQLLSMFVPVIEKRLKRENAQLPVTDVAVIDAYAKIRQKIRYIHGKIANFNLLDEMIKSGKINEDNIIISTDTNYIKKIIENDGKLVANKVVNGNKVISAYKVVIKPSMTEINKDQFREIVKSEQEKIFGSGNVWIGEDIGYDDDRVYFTISIKVANTSPNFLLNFVKNIMWPGIKAAYLKAISLRDVF